MSATMKPRPTRRQVDAALAMQSPPPRDEADAALAKLDAVAREMETTWGVGRLPLLVSDFLAAKFHSQADKLDAALGENDRAMIRQRAEAMARGWRALDEAARQEHTPQPALVWHGSTPSGRAFAIVRDPADATRVGQGVPIYSLDDIGALLDQQPAPLHAVKAEFPKSAIKPFDPVEGDEIPW